MKRLTRAILPPLVVWVLARGLVMLAGAVYGVDPRPPGQWIHWDAHHYREIARSGDTLFWSELPQPGWKGTAAWFPLYPYTVRAVVALSGINLDVAMVLVPAVFFLMTLLLIWNRWILPGDASHKWLILATAAVFPGVTYQFAPFPMSMTTFFATVHLHGLIRRRWVLAGVAGALAATTHPVGAALAAVAALWSVWPRKSGTSRSERGGAALTAIICALGFAVVLLIHQMTVGRWDAFLLIQAGGQSLWPRAPWVPIEWALRLLGQSLRFQAAGHQLLLVCALVISLLIAMWRQRARLRDADRILGIFCALFCLFTLIVPVAWSEHRQHAILLPSVVLTRFLPLRTRALVLILSILVAYEMARRFLPGYLT